MSYDVIQDHVTHRLDAPLPTGNFLSFFSLLKKVFEALIDRKGDLTKVSFLIINSLIM